MSNPWLAIDVATAPAQRAREVREPGSDPSAAAGVDGDHRFEIVYEECAEALGWDDFGNDDFEEIMSTHYGRMVTLDDRIIMFCQPRGCGGVH